MRSLPRVFGAAIFTAATLTPPALAQRYSTENFGKGLATVSVQYMIRMPLKSDDIAEQRDAMEQGRKLLYQMGSGECALIIASFASTCQLTNISVSTNISRQRDDNAANMTASAQFRVELKQKGDANPDVGPKASP
jgi:hypothetical protein